MKEKRFRIASTVVAIGVGLSALAGCASSQTGSGSATPSQVDTTSFPPFVSTCDHGNRLYVIWLPNEPDQVAAVRDSSCPLS